MGGLINLFEVKETVDVVGFEVRRKLKTGKVVSFYTFFLPSVNHVSERHFAQRVTNFVL